RVFGSLIHTTGGPPSFKASRCAKSSSASGNAQHRMVALPGGIFERGGDVSGFKQRMIFEDFLARGARCEQVEDVLHADAQPAKTGSPAALGGIDGDAVRF